jgi:hypothetical protein
MPYEMTPVSSAAGNITKVRGCQFAINEPAMIRQMRRLNITLGAANVADPSPVNAAGAAAPTCIAAVL